MRSILPELPLELRAAAEFRNCQPAACDFDGNPDLAKAAVSVWWLINVKRPVGLDRRFITFLREPGEFLTAGLNRLQSLVWLFRKDLQQAFDIRNPEGLHQFRQWYEHHSAGEIGDIESLCRPPAGKPRRYRRDGVNLIGMVTAELGLGEDIRMMARCLDRQGINYCCYNYPHSKISRLNAREIEDKCTTRLEYAVSIFCLPWEEIFRAYHDLGADFFRNHYNLAYSPWELPKFPKSLMPVTEIVDEFWCATSYVAGALDGVTRKPVSLMPMAVSIDVASADRKSFGIDEDKFAYLYIFDCLSHGQRKNPLGAIAAFQRAFSDRREPVALVVKTMHLNFLPERYRRNLTEAIGADDRIVLIDEVYDREKILGLYRSVDAYVSLHRAEGFGRTIIEAMLSGLPAIVSAFSGNMDYCNSQNAYLVDGNEIAVGDHYPRADESQFWFDPDVESAAKAMLDCYVNPVSRCDKVLTALDDAKKFSMEAVSKRYDAEIRNLIKKLP